MRRVRGFSFVPRARAGAGVAGLGARRLAMGLAGAAQGARARRGGVLARGEREEWELHRFLLVSGLPPSTSLASMPRAARPAQRAAMNGRIGGAKSTARCLS
ncbi:hypothetical protein, partial [Cupriavidus sp. WS]|uniref:hypothetical protein n=1 Tax=Cupriavidus sp. WS TaxID=1312922 RepID=UPI001E622C2D